MKNISSILKFLFFCGFVSAGSLSVLGAEKVAGLPKSFAEFEKSTSSGATMPAGLSEPLQVMWHSKAGKWDAAHDIAETLKTTTGSWVHAFLHREEGDRANAGYWYRKAGMTIPSEGVAIAEEWSLIARELWQREYGTVAGEETLTASSGLVATTVKSADEEEGAWDTLIQRDGKPVLRIANARPVSFSPPGDVLLLIEAAADDDCRHFLINPTAGQEIPPFGKRKRIGGRSVTGHKWSEDGKSLTLTPDAAAGDGKPETIVVAEQLTSK
jgi:hypothetical protein